MVSIALRSLSIFSLPAILFLTQTLNFISCTSNKECTARACHIDHTKLTLHSTVSLLKRDIQSTITINVFNQTLHFFSEGVPSEDGVIKYKFNSEKPSSNFEMGSATLAYDLSKNELHITITNGVSLWSLEPPKDYSLKLEIRQSGKTVLLINEYTVTFTEKYYPNGEGCSPVCWRAEHTLKVRPE